MTNDIHANELTMQRFHLARKYNGLLLAKPNKDHNEMQIFLGVCNL